MSISISTHDACVDFPIFDAKTRSLKKAFLGKAGGAIDRNSSDVVVVEALKNITMNLKDGDRVGLVGHNGAGKSTLLRLCAGLLEPDAGRILLGGVSLSSVGARAQRHLGYVPDATEPLPEILVGEFVALVSALKQAPPPPPELAERLSVRELWTQRLSTLSFGQRKRACVLAAHVGDPWLLVLDEPTNGLDPAGSALMQSLLVARAAAGKATILATNDAPFAVALASTTGGRQLSLGGGRLTPLVPGDVPAQTAQNP